MSWEKPDYIEVNMSAEIGGYQDDFEERTPFDGGALKQPTTNSEGNEA